MTQSEPSYEMEIHQQLQRPSSSIDLKADSNGDNAEEEILEKCVEVIRSEFGVQWVRLTLNKQGAVRGARDVGVIIERGERT